MRLTSPEDSRPGVRPRKGDLAMPSKEFEALLEAIKSRPVPTGLSMQERRANFEAMPRPSLADDVRYERVEAGGVPGEWITVPESRETRVVYYLHGGGYVLGSVSTHRELISRLARVMGARALAIDYRLASEHPFPAAVDDAVAGYRWLLSTGVDPAGVVIGGDSAGGGLVVACLVALRDAGDRLPAAGICLSPWVDMEAIGESMTAKPEAERMMLREGLLEMAKAYLGGADPRTPLAAPLYADLRGLPPLLIQVSKDEELYSDATRLAEVAKAAGVETVLEPWEDMIHVWQFQAALIPEGREAIERIGEFVRGKVG